MKHVLSPEQTKAVGEVEQHLARLQRTLDGWEERPESRARIDEARAGLSELFLLVVTGEFNAGKSALINALLGGEFLEQGVTPTTSQIQVLQFGSEREAVEVDGVWRRSLPVELLRELHVVDTPGTNAVLREHEALTRDFVPRADLVLFVTSADRPFTESERDFLTTIRDWGKKIVFVVNKIDLLEAPEERVQVLEFVDDQARTLLQTPAVVFPVSARRARRAKEDGVASLDPDWKSFEAWLHNALTEGERVRLKLLTPLGVAERVSHEAVTALAARRQVLAEDRATLAEIDRTLAKHRSEQHERFEERVAAIDARVADLRGRGETFLDERIRLARLRGLLDGESLRADFEREVIADTPTLVTADVSALIDWLIDQESTMWRAIRERVTARAGAEGLEPSRDQETGFAQRRQDLLGEVGSEAAAALESFDPRREAERLERGVQDALTKTALAEVGALGLGVLIPLLIGSTAADVTGVVAGSVLAVVGLTLLPHRRRRAADLLREKVATLRAELRDGLAKAFVRELERAEERMEGSVGPYRAFVMTELDRLASTEEELVRIQAAGDALRTRIGRLGTVDEPAPSVG